MSRAFDLLVEMNPVQHPDLVDGPVADWHQGPSQRLQPSAVRRGWTTAAAAAAVVVIVSAGIWLVGIGGDGRFAPGATALAGRTESLFAAFTAGDYDTFGEPFSDDVALSSVSGWRFVTAAVEDTPAIAPADFGFRVVAECTETRPRVVRCDVTQRGDVFERMGVTIPGTANIVYDDAGAVYVMNLDSRLQVDAVTVLDEWAQWLRATHRDVFDATFDAFSDEQIPPNGIDTVDNRAAWTALVGEFLADRSEG